MSIRTRLFSAALAVGTLTSVLAVSPAPASASTDPAVGAAIGAIVGQLLLDQNRNQYYYVNNSRRVYVRDNDAQQYFYRRDPNFYHAHAGDFRNNRSHFNQQWQNNQHRGHGYGHERDHGYHR